MQTPETPEHPDAALTSPAKAQNAHLKTPDERATLQIMTHVTLPEHDRFMALYTHYIAGRKISVSEYVRMKLLEKWADGDVYTHSLTVHHFEQLMKLNNELLNTLKIIKKELPEMNLSGGETNSAKRIRERVGINEWLTKAESELTASYWHALELRNTVSNSKQAINSLKL